MDESEKVSAVIALNHLLEGQAHALDLLVSAFAAAVRCGRRATGKTVLGRILHHSVQQRVHVISSYC
jgi:hypothetical protein